MLLRVAAEALAGHDDALEMDEQHQRPRQAADGSSPTERKYRASHRAGLDRMLVLHLLFAVRREVARIEWTTGLEIDGCELSGSSRSVLDGLSPALTCAAGDGGVRSSGESRSGARSIRVAAGEGKTGRVCDARSHAYE